MACPPGAFGGAPRLFTGVPGLVGVGLVGLVRVTHSAATASDDGSGGASDGRSEGACAGAVANPAPSWLCLARPLGSTASTASTGSTASAGSITGRNQAVAEPANSDDEGGLGRIVLSLGP